MRNAALSVLIVTLAAIGACNRTADRAPGGSPQASSSPSVNQPSSAATQPRGPSAGSGTSNTPEPPSKELSKQDESTGQPRPGQGGSDHSTPAREPGAKG
jgi:hypothetical protein